MALPLPHEKNPDISISLSVRVLPRSSRDEVVGAIEGALKVKLTAPPFEGAANEHLVRFFSKLFDLNKSRIRIATGEKSRDKVVVFEPLSAEEADIIKSYLGKLTAS